MRMTRNFTAIMM